MKELKDIQFGTQNILLQDNRVKGAILPEKVSELTRNVIVKGDSEILGPVYANRIEIQNGGLRVEGAVFASNEIYIDSNAKGDVRFEKCVATVGPLASRAAGCKPCFCSDINAKTVALYNAFVAGSIYADEITLENSVVIGGVFATQSISITSSIVGTFNTPFIQIAGVNYMLLPSAFSIEKMVATAGAKLYNLTLADLGALYKGLPESEESGKIEIDVKDDEIKSNLTDGEKQQTLRSYTVIGKVLAADLMDSDKFQNHFLLTAAGLGPQLLKTYDLGIGKDGEIAVLTEERIQEFFNNVLNGKIPVRTMDTKFDISAIINRKN